MNYLEMLTNQQIRLLLQEMSISKKENIADIPFSVINGVLHVTHGKTEKGIIESIYNEFEIVKIYNSAPSNYDQKRYQNIMSILLEKEQYRKSLNEHQAKIENEK